MNDPSAPPGPRYMPEYEDPLTEKATELNKEASHAFDLGVEPTAPPARTTCASPSSSPRCCS